MRCRPSWYVTLPNIRSAMHRLGAALAFTLSFDEIPVTFFLTGRDNTLPMYIWSTLRRGITPEINAVGTRSSSLASARARSSSPSWSCGTAAATS